MVLSAEGCEKAKHTDMVGDEYLVRRTGYIDPSRIEAVVPCETMPDCIFVLIGSEEHTVVEDMIEFVARVDAFIKRNSISRIN